MNMLNQLLARAALCAALYRKSFGLQTRTIRRLRKARVRPPCGTASGIAIVISTLNNPWFRRARRNRHATMPKELGYDATVFDSQNLIRPKKPLTSETPHCFRLQGRAFQSTLTLKDHIASVRKAKAAGVPVFCMDREINANDTPAVSADFCPIAIPAAWRWGSKLCQTSW